MEDSDHQSHQSGAIIGSNDDLLTEILLWLPVTSILRFKSVSKHWQSLLSHRSFTLLYDKLSKSPGLFVRDTFVPFDSENRGTPPFHSLDFYFDCPGIRIMQSCNGLLLCCSDQWNGGSRRYYVFNPTTKQVSIIPWVPGGKNGRRTIRFMGLAFHHTDSPHYKLVCIRSLECVGELLDLFQTQMYSSDTGKWEVSIESFSAHNHTFDKGVYWNGAFHWPPCYHRHLYFKIEAQQLETLPMPVEMMSSGTETVYFGESRGHLHLIVNNYRDYNSLYLNVYEMISDHSGWFVKYHVQLDELTATFLEMIYMSSCNFNVIDVVRGEKEEDTFIVLRTPGKLITYNVHDMSFKEIYDLSDYFSDGYPNFHRYTETLSSF